MDVSPSELESNQNIIYITEEENSRIEWTHEATKELLKIYDEKLDMLDTGIISTQKKLWELTSKALAKLGYNFTGAQCENKWKTLKRGYRLKLERVHKFGSAKRACPFQHEIAEILSKRPINDTYSRVYSIDTNEIGKQEELFGINLNEPPGFAKQNKNMTVVRPQYVDVNNVTLAEDDFDADEAKLIGESPEPVYTVIQNANQAGLVEEISDLKRAVIRHNKMHLHCLKQLHETQEKTLECIEKAVEGYEEMKNIEEEKLKQQSEMVTQMKTQNELLQKILEKVFG